MGQTIVQNIEPRAREGRALFDELIATGEEIRSDFEPDRPLSAEPGPRNSASGAERDPESVTAIEEVETASDAGEAEIEFLVPGLGRAIARFEAGLQRPVALEALSDNLLALRFVLDGGGPANLGLSMRVAALCAAPDRRAEVKAVVDRALALERELWSGEPHGGGPVPAETATRLAELTRAILKDAACGHLGTDLRVTADEILLADGIGAGDGADQRGETEEWGADEQEVQMTVRAHRADPAPAEVPTAVVETVPRAVVEPLPRPRPEPEPMPEADPERVPPGNRALRLIEQTRAERDARANRIANLFPPPDTCEWNVGELGYDRRRRAAASH